MTACVLIITLAGEIVGCLPPEKVAEMPTMWERLLDAVEKARG
jgi:hypothetical protein